VPELAGPGVSWGWQVGIDRASGRYGWTGGSGTSASVDPSRDLIGVMFTQRFMSGPQGDFAYFWGPVADAVG
jgi:Beta-lactamase.